MLFECAEKLNGAIVRLIFLNPGQAIGWFVQHKAYTSTEFADKQRVDLVQTQ